MEYSVATTRRTTSSKTKRTNIRKSVGVVEEGGNNNSTNRSGVIEESAVYYDDHSSSSIYPSEEFVIVSSDNSSSSATLPNVDEFLPDYKSKKQIDPFRRLSALDRDCVLLVEFSELEGPKPTLCIPDSPGAHFERNDFAVWLMTADYQASNHRGGNGPLFHISEDIQMLLSNDEQGVHTYAHHFTLFDIEARGYVRPFCATYVTPDPGKLTRLFDTLREEFTAILKPVKLCNRRQFRAALTEAAEALNVIETQAISCYYELFHHNHNHKETSPPQQQQQQETKTTPSPDELNTRYRKLQRQLLIAQHAVSDDIRRRLLPHHDHDHDHDHDHQEITSTAAAACHGDHSVNMDQWINSLRRGDRPSFSESPNNIGDQQKKTKKKTLQELPQLCPCVHEETTRRLRSVWMKYRHWNNGAAARCIRPPDQYGAKLNLGSVPILYLPPQPSSSTKSSAEIPSPFKRNNDKRKKQTIEFSVSEADALHTLQEGSTTTTKDGDNSDDYRLLCSTLAPHLRYVLYPLLTGQLLIAYGGDLRRALIDGLIRKLKHFIPTIFASPSCYSCTNSGGGVEQQQRNQHQITESTLNDYKLLGLRVNRKENIADRFADPTLMRRYVALLDLNTDVFHVADYKGEILNRFVNRCVPAHRSDRTLITAVFAGVASELAMLAYVYRYCSSDQKKLFLQNQDSVSGNSSGGNGFWKIKKQQQPPPLESLKLQQGDLKIVRYLVELLKMQQRPSAADAEDGEERERRERDLMLDDDDHDPLVLLEYEPAHSHKM